MHFTDDRSPSLKKKKGRTARGWIHFTLWRRRIPPRAAPAFTVLFGCTSDEK
jgi:hypothetical protein